MSPIIFCGTTSLPVFEYSSFFMFFINEHITLIIAFFASKYLTVRLLELLKMATPILPLVQIVDIRFKHITERNKIF
jgi:hypothetical protein